MPTYPNTKPVGVAALQSSKKSNRFPIASDGFQVDPLTASDEQFNFSGLHNNRTVKGGMRVHEIAKVLGAQSKDVRDVARSVGVMVKSPSSMVEPLCARALITYIMNSGVLAEPYERG